MPVPATASPTTAPAPATTPATVRRLPRAVTAAGAVLATVCVLLPLPASATGGPAAVPATVERSQAHHTVLQVRPAYVDPASDAATAARTARAEGRPGDAQLLEKVAAQSTARWLGPADGTARVRAYAQAAVAAGTTPVVVTYAIPDRDCGSHSGGGIATPAEYRAWVDAVAAGLAGARAVVVVEPDALLHLDRCGDRGARLAMLRYSVDAYAAVGAEVYLDGASSNSFGWSARHLADIAQRLRDAGVDRAAGFAVNTSNFQTGAQEVAYGERLSALVGGAAFVVDTSRNGNGPLAGPNGTVWCNPEGRALGNPPRATGTGPHVADLWLKTPGRSDGTCNGGPAAGRFWEAYLLGLAARAAW
ncbi:glycoside hydrolase family 6 protein [Cellulomonas sp. zg-ZUI22]|uniref:glycoside hydrolase family 6 protein n=1 Tax=Cellulomonas sp. zg-ZUI22 TaxID=2816955 RepID=UPI001A95012F|nr:glycoside hydrolase family 6 protein [Cellulomonas sp. zg-ZUI22]MBO0901123.1 glycoside hydrolase family 6 protein [Cellulomonas sp. zg-ZUI22]